jgi:adenylosuccinate synthase
MDQLKGKSEDIDNLEEVIDLDRDMERYVKKIKTTTGISNGHI